MLRINLIKCLITLGMSNTRIKKLTGCNECTTRKYRREIELEKMTSDLKLDEKIKYPHLKSKEIMDDFNNQLAEKMKTNIETLTEKLSEQLDNDVKVDRTSIKDFAVATTLLNESYRKTTGQDKQVVDVNHNIMMFPSAPSQILKHYRPSEKVIDAKIINNEEEIIVPDELMKKLPEEFHE